MVGVVVGFENKLELYIALYEYLKYKLYPNLKIWNYLNVKYQHLKTEQLIELAQIINSLLVLRQDKNNKEITYVTKEHIQTNRLIRIKSFLKNDLECFNFSNTVDEIINKFIKKLFNDIQEKEYNVLNELVVKSVNRIHNKNEESEQNYEAVPQMVNKYEYIADQYEQGQEKRNERSQRKHFDVYDLPLGQLTQMMNKEEHIAQNYETVQ